MNTTPCPTEEREPVLAILRRVKVKKSTRKWVPDAIEVIYRVGEVVPQQARKKPFPWKWVQVANHAEFTGPLAYETAKEFVAMMKAGATRDSGECCNLDRGGLAAEAPLWKNIEDVEVV